MQSHRKRHLQDQKSQINSAQHLLALEAKLFKRTSPKQYVDES